MSDAQETQELTEESVEQEEQAANEAETLNAQAEESAE